MTADDHQPRRGDNSRTAAADTTRRDCLWLWRPVLFTYRLEASVCCVPFLCMVRFSIIVIWVQLEPCISVGGEGDQRVPNSFFSPRSGSFTLNSLTEIVLATGLATYCLAASVSSFVSVRRSADGCLSLTKTLLVKALTVILLPFVYCNV